jgi:hypothetical protein
LPNRNLGDVEIPVTEWRPFLESFSLQHEGWLASLSVACESKASIEVSNCRLRRIAIHCGAEKCRVNISLLADNKPQTHSVADPLHLTFKRDTAGAHQGLDVSSADGSVTILRFRAAARPETLDGVLPSLNRWTLNGPLAEFCGQSLYE